MSQMLIPNDVYVSGNLAAKTATLPTGCVLDASVAGAAGIQASKLVHQHWQHYRQSSNVNASSDQALIHYVYGATASIVQLVAGAVVLLTGNDTVTVDLWKNGSTILTSVISLSATDTVRVGKTPAGYTSTSLVSGDFLEIKITATHNTGTLPQGVFARLIITETAQ